MKRIVGYLGREVNSKHSGLYSKGVLKICHSQLMNGVQIPFVKMNDTLKVLNYERINIFEM